MIDSIKILLPEIILGSAALILLIVDVMSTRRLKSWVLVISLTSLLFVLYFLLFPMSTGRAFGLVVSDGFSSFFKILAVASTFLVFLLSEKDSSLMNDNAGTYASLILLSTMGVLFLASTEELLMLFVGLELTTIPLFILAGYHRKDVRSSEGAIKFFLIGAFSSALMIYGISFIYGICGSTHFKAIGDWYRWNQPGNFTLFLIGLSFLLVGLGFKMTLVPFHQWTPDAYEGAPTPITAFFAISREAGIIAVLLRLFVGFVDHTMVGITDLFIVLSMLTMTIGNITALRQTNLKRLLAYSSIAHAGTIFIGVIAGNEMGLQGTMLYSLAYTLMSLGAFSVVIAVSRKKGSDDINAIQGLGQENFPMALLMTLFLLSLSGIPPFLGFLGKFYVFAAAIKSGHYALVVIGLLNSVIAVYYYFRIAHKMFFSEPLDASEDVSTPISLRVVTVLTATALVFLGIFPQTLVHWIQMNSHILP